MSEKKGSILPSLELLLIAAFFIGFAVWAFRKCSATQAKYSRKAETEHIRNLEDSLGHAIKNAKKDTIVPVATPTVSSPALAVLYVSIEGLKVRKTPNLNAEILESLSLFDEVYYLNEVTDSQTTVNLGKETVTEPWVKIQTRKGRSGWVFGAGVHYYRRKHPGAE
jgi:hypothetical protein